MIIEVYVYMHECIHKFFVKCAGLQHQELLNNDEAASIGKRLRSENILSNSRAESSRQTILYINNN